MSIGTLSIANNGNTIFGNGSVSEVSAQLEGLGVTRPFVITDQGIADSGLLEKFKKHIPNLGNNRVFLDTPANPNEASVKAASEAYRDSGANGIIGFGGGSPLDLAKAASLSVSHEGPLWKYTTHHNGVKHIGETPPVIAIPTTAGTGSEVSRAAVIILASGEKRIIFSPNLIPDISILDPELTVGLPPFLTAATGMDAITHCIEAISSPKINASADAIGASALKDALCDGALMKAVKNGEDLDARSTMLSVSTRGGMAFSKGLGAVHAMSHACGKDEDLRLHHGTLNAVILPTVLKFNSEFLGDKLSLIKAAIGVPKNKDIAEYFLDLNAELGMPSNLSEMGISSGMLPSLSEHAVTDNTAATNPVKLDAAGYLELFNQSLIQ